MSAAIRQARLRARREAEGIVPYTVWVPAACVADLQRQAELLRAYRHLTIGPLRDPVTGRLVSLVKSRALPATP